MNNSYIGVPMENILKLEVMKESKILAGEKGIIKRVAKVNVMEVPDIEEWVSEDEFLLTTAYSIKDNPYALQKIIPVLSKKGVVGLGIKIKRYIESLPKEVLQLADELEFPIIELPFNKSHTQIISCVLSEVISNQMELLLNVADFNKEIMDIMIDGGNVKDIIEKLQLEIHNNIGIYDDIYDIFEFCGEEEYKGCIKENIYSDFLRVSDHSISYERDNNFILDNVSIEGENLEKFIFPVIIEKINYGCLVVLSKVKEISPIEVLLIKSCIHIIALDFVKKLSINKIESNYRYEFFQDLLSKHENRRNKAMEKTHIFNLRTDFKYCAAVIRFIDEKEKVVEGKNKTKFILRRTLKVKEKSILYVENNRDIIILFGMSRENENREILESCVELCNKIVSRNIIGIGVCSEKIHGLYKSYNQAQWIVSHFYLTHYEKVLKYEELGFLKFIYKEELKLDFELFAKEQIGKIIEYDKSNNTYLLDTLRTYFNCDGNIRAVSSKMYLHYNTILYRIEKIKTLTCADFNLNDDRLNLQLAIKIWDTLVNK